MRRTIIWGDRIISYNTRILYAPTEFEAPVLARLQVPAIGISHLA